MLSSVFDPLGASADAVPFADVGAFASVAECVSVDPVAFAVGAAFVVVACGGTGAAGASSVVVG